MAGENEEFAAGLELPVSSGANAQAAAAVSGGETQSDWFGEVRNQVEGIPADWTQANFVDNLLAMQQQAAEADELRAKVNEYEAYRAAQGASTLSAAQQKLQEQQPVVQTPAEGEYESPYKIYRNDPNLMPFVQRDESGFYVPKDKFNSLHINAAEQMNLVANYRAQLTNDLYDNPEETISKLSKRQIESIERKHAKEMEELKAIVNPLRDAWEQQQRQSEVTAFVDKNRAKLYGEDEKLTPIGMLVDTYMTEGDTADVALKKAELAAAQFGYQATPPQQTPAAKVTLSKAANKPNRFVDQMAERLRGTGQPPPERNQFEGGNGKFRKTFAELDAEFADQP